MIPVARKPEPANFNEKVRIKGRAIKLPPPPVRSEFWKNKEYWRNALDELCLAYGRICAFTGFRIERVTGARSVEHFLPRKWHPELAYEWDNLRLVCMAMNSRKGANLDVLDPFEIPNETFDLNPLTGEVRVHRNCPKALRDRAEQTRVRLKLNEGECTFIRLEQIEKYTRGRWSEEELEHQSPFVHQCLREQGLL